MRLYYYAYTHMCLEVTFWAIFDAAYGWIALKIEPNSDDFRSRLQVDMSFCGIVSKCADSKFRSKEPTSKFMSEKCSSQPP